MRPREDLVPRWDIHEEHLDEACFLWTRWERCLVSPEFNLDETGEQELRLVSHLEALSDGGSVVTRRFLLPALASDEPERIATAAQALLAGGGEKAHEEVLAILETAGNDEDDDALRRAAIQRALELWEATGHAERLEPLLASATPALQALALEVLAFHGEAPPNGLAGFAVHEDVRVRVAALRCAQFLPESMRSGFLPAALASPSPAVRLAGLQLGLLRRERTAWSASRQLARTPSPEQARAWVLLALCGGEQELEPVLQGLGDATSRAQALWALGFSGRRSAADACIELLREEPRVATLAAEAFSSITGLRIEGPFADEAPKEDAPLPPLEEDDLDADLLPGPEEDLPLPAVEAIESWWGQARKRFEPGVRLLLGQPFSSEALLLALAQAPMRRRHLLALELALRSGGTLRIQTRARVTRQRREWQAASDSRLLLPLHPLMG